MNWLAKLFGGGIAGGDKRAATQGPAANLKVAWRLGSFPMEAVGESYYQRALARLCGGHNRHGHEVRCDAILLPEPDNPHDRNAHRVMIGGHLVGYVPRDHAARFASAVAAIGRPGAAVCLPALIRGGWRTNQYDEGHFGVRLGAPVRGDIIFEGYAPPPKPPAPLQTKTSRTTAPVEITPDDLEALEALIRRLKSTPLLSSEEAARRSKAFYSEASRRMLEEGVSSGVASGAPDHLTQGEAHFRAEMARMDNLLGEQVRIFQYGLDQWFDHGETFAPYYPFRIAVILRKAKRGDLERAFLAAYVEHFAEFRMGGARYGEILARAEKMGIDIALRGEALPV